MTPVVSILICTRDRDESLRDTLAAIERVDIPADLPAELLVIENGSADATRATVDKYRTEKWPIRFIREHRVGKGYAYNAGLAAARGEIILFTDDDVRPPKNWIEGMCRPISNGQALATQGAICMPAVYRTLDLPHNGHEFRDEFLTQSHIDDPFLIGANMAISLRALRQIGGFDTELGPGARGFMDDTLVCQQLKAAGHKIRYVKGVSVEHWFDTARMSSKNTLEEARRHGRSSGYVIHHWEHRSQSWASLKYAITRLTLPTLLAAQRIVPENHKLLNVLGRWTYRRALLETLIEEKGKARKYARH